MVKIGLPRLHVHRAFGTLERRERAKRDILAAPQAKAAMNAPDANVAATAALFPPAMPALLALADGTMFRGHAIGASGTTVGEVVFNTAMTGYQEILTDPSYAGQIVTLTCPHIGNVGVNAEDVESKRIHVAGLVIRDLPRLASSWRSQQDLATYLRDGNIVGIADIDTRKLTRILRERGAQNACIVAGPGIDDAAAAEGVRKARAAPSMAGLDLAKVVSCTVPYEWTSGAWSLACGYRPMGAPRFHVVAYDYGVKHNILRMLAERGCRLTVVPAQTPAVTGKGLPSLRSQPRTGDRNAHPSKATTFTRRYARA